MKNKILSLMYMGALGLALSSCFGQHNQAPSKGANLDDHRIYGVKGGEPEQLKARDWYPKDSASTATAKARIGNIKTILYN